MRIIVMTRKVVGGVRWLEWFLPSRTNQGPGSWLLLDDAIPHA